MQIIGTKKIFLADVLENIRNKCLEIVSELDPVWICTAPGLAWQATLKKVK